MNKGLRNAIATLIVGGGAILGASLGILATAPLAKSVDQTLEGKDQENEDEDPTY